MTDITLFGPRTLSILSLEIDDNYRKQLIDEVYRLAGNFDHKTNVKGKRTSYFLFKESDMFENFLHRVNELKSCNTWFVEPDKNSLGKLVLSNFWGAVYSKGDYTKRHNHNNASFSFVYYLQTNNCSTPLVFDELNYSYTPIENEIIFFPSDLTHHVPYHNYDKDRIVLAGNFYYMMDKSILTTNQQVNIDLKNGQVSHEYS